MPHTVWNACSVAHRQKKQAKRSQWLPRTWVNRALGISTSPSRSSRGKAVSLRSAACSAAAKAAAALATASTPSERGAIPQPIGQLQRRTRAQLVFASQQDNSVSVHVIRRNCSWACATGIEPLMDNWRIVGELSQLKRGHYLASDQQPDSNLNVQRASTYSAANGAGRAMRLQSARGQVQRGSVSVDRKRGRLVEGAAHSSQARSISSDR
eukprot:6207030-Pleurochrysis_carterae.AAC.1